MQEKNAAISTEEARDLFKTPTSNLIEVDVNVKVKMLLFDIKNKLMHFDEVKMIAHGKSIGKALSASQLLVEENVAEIISLKTDLEGEEPRYKPVATISLKPRKKLSD